MERCDICITEDCGGKKKCHCDTCAQIQKCNKVLRPVIRITNKCTQSCRHCCFSCSPKLNDHMSIDTALSLSSFLQMYGIKKVSIMGGEFFCNPNWLEIFKILLPHLDYCRLVTNGDWAEDEDFLRQLSPYNRQIALAISEDRWHSNRYTRQAVEQCEKFNMYWTLPTRDMQQDTALVPVGRLEGDPSGFFGFFSTYCSNPEHHYSFLIDEVGDIFKCSFGVSKYTNINKHFDGSFPETFKKYNQSFYGNAPMNCYQCTINRGL